MGRRKVANLEAFRSMGQRADFMVTESGGAM